mmetsp:Transcript_19387/g.40445  ORF Transcript_19387/g.40445 Transcript_19387/m.40445 type:complete len:209 (-) Transcript_19387:1710-2336(-)
MVPELSSSKNWKANFIAFAMLSFMSSAARAVAIVSMWFDLLLGEPSLLSFLSGDLTVTFLSSSETSSSSEFSSSASSSSSSSESSFPFLLFLPFCAFWAFFLPSSIIFFPIALAAVKFRAKFLFVICFTMSPYFMISVFPLTASFLNKQFNCPMLNIAPRLMTADLNSSFPMVPVLSEVENSLKVLLNVRAVASTFALNLLMYSTALV